MSDKDKIKQISDGHEVFEEWQFAAKDAAPNDLPVINRLWGKTRKWRFDFAIPSLRVAWEIEGGVWSGGRHIRGGGFLGDVDKYNTATALGWMVIRSDNTEKGKAKALQAIAEIVKRVPQT